MDADDLTVTDQAEQRRFVAAGQDAEAELVYRVHDRNLVLVHTEVPDAFRGRGVGARLVGAALDRARATGETIVPRCAYARRWLREHPQALDGVVVDWEE